MTSAIQVSAVRKKYGDVTALDGASFMIERGEFFGILGPNGAGKSTLIEIMAGLRRADAGSVTVLGRPVWPRDPRLLRQVGMQTQAPAFFSKLTATEHVETVAALYGIRARQARRAIALAGLTEKRHTRIEHLSGGQRQRLAIAAAIVHEPELIFFDEPMAAVDTHARMELHSLLTRIRRQGRTIVYTTHQLDEAEEFCDRVAILSRGSVIAVDTPSNLARRIDGTSRVSVPRDLLPPHAAWRIPGVEDVATEGSWTVVTTRRAGPVLSLAERLGGLQRVNMRPARLEDVYLEMTGKDHEQ